MANLSTERVSFEQALANLLAAYAIDGGTGSGTILATRLTLINYVKAKLDEIIPEGEGLQFSVEGDINISDPLNLLINAILDEAAKRVLLNAPLHVLDPVVSEEVAVHDVKDSKIGYIMLPANYLRFVSLKMVDWNRPVFELTPVTSKKYQQQFNPYLRGGITKPIAAITHFIDQVDYYLPVITLVGSYTINLYTNDTVVDPGAIAVDANDGDLTADIVVTNNVDNTTPGTYYIEYNVSDEAGNAAKTVKRKYVVSLPLLATVTTTVARNITDATAIVGGEVTFDGWGTVDLRGVVWNTTGNPTINDTVFNQGTGIGLYSGTIGVLHDPLPQNTLIYYRAFAENQAGVSYGEVMSFTTEIGFPIVETAVATNITATTATVGGDIISNGGGTIYSYGTVWNTIGNPTLEDNPFNQGLDNVTGIFSGVIGSGVNPPLPSNTLIYYRAWVENEAGVSYGEVFQLTTLTN